MPTTAAHNHRASTWHCRVARKADHHSGALNARSAELQSNTSDRAGRIRFMSTQTPEQASRLRTFVAPVIIADLAVRPLRCSRR